MVLSTTRKSVCDSLEVQKTPRSRFERFHGTKTNIGEYFSSSVQLFILDAGAGYGIAFFAFYMLPLPLLSLWNVVDWQSCQSVRQKSIAVWLPML